VSILDRLFIWRDKPTIGDQASHTVSKAVEGFEVDGCFTLPEAQLEDLAETPVGGPEDARTPDDFA
jgi:hypothetical protein